MSTRRLVQRSRQHDESSPAPRSHQRESQAGPRQRGAAPRQLTPLPPYEPPSCPLTATARNELDQLRLNHDYTKYQMHLKTGKVNLTNATADAHDRLRLRRQLVEKEANKRRKDGGVEKTEAELEAEQRADALEAKVVDLTEKAEKAMREMIDYGDELAMNDTIMKDISENIPPAPASQPVRRRQRLGDDDDDENEGPEEEVWEEVPDVPGVSTIDLLNQAKEDYAANYTSKSMRARYENTDYATFKRTIHVSQHGQDGPPPPHARTWFTEGSGVAAAGSNRRQTNANDDDVSDDDIVIARASVNLKCPLTLQYFKEPYSNHICKHSFEKSAIIEYHRNEAVAFGDPAQRGRNRQPMGPRRVKCPQTGCHAMLELKDFYDDTLLARQVKHAEKEAAREEDEDEDEEEDEVAPRGTQRSRPEQIDSDEVDIDEEDEAEQHRQHIAKVKRERGQSRGLSLAPNHLRNESSEPGEDNLEAMDVD